MVDSHSAQQHAPRQPEVSDYERIGGGPAVTTVVDAFYSRVLSDPQLSGYFTDVDIPRLKRHQVLLVSQVLGGPAQYDGRDLAAAHSGLGVTSDDFGRVVEHLVESMQEATVPPEIIGRVGGALAGSESDIVADQPSA
jgi:hemoglobin